MQIAFIMPSEYHKKKIERLRESVVDFRPDQVRYFEHLLRSWGAFGRPDGFNAVWRAVKRTLRDRP